MLAVARAPAVRIHDPIGETVGRYRIVALLGKGGMGRVYEAEDLELGRRVAIKFLPVAFVERPENLARFVRERVVTADLEHPAIIPLYDSGVWSSGEPYFVMRQVQGDPLHRRLQGARTLEERLLLLPSIIATAEAVAFAHSRGVIHRDLKPANILVGSFGETFVADWGLAKRLKDDELQHGDRPDAIVEPHETRVGVVLGTPAYMAPEQSQGWAVDERADVYAMGAMLHELLVGATPSEGTTETSDPALAGRPRGLTDLPPTMRDLVAITRKALAADPAERYANATELALELRRVQAGQLVDARRYSRSELAWRWMVRHRAPVLVAAAMTATLAVVVLVSLVRIVRERDQERADRAAAEAAHQQAAERNDALVLQEARAELDRDPTSSLAWLKQYPAAAGGWSEAVRIAADAVARGVATRVWTLGAPLGCVAFSPDGKTLAIGATDGTLTLLDVETSKRRSFRAPDGVGTRVVFSPDGSVLATTDTTDAARLWNAATGESRRLPGDHAGGVVAAFSEDSTMLRTRRALGSDRLWSIPSGELVSLPSADSRIAFAPRPGTIFAAAADRIDEVEVASGRVLATAPLDGAPYDVAVSGPWVAASRYDALVLWNPATGARRRIQVGKVVVRVVSPSQDGRSFVTCGLEREDWLFDVASATGRLFSSEEGCTRQAFSFSPDSKLFVSAGLGGELRIHDRWATRLLHGHDLAVTDAVFSPDGRLLASVSSDGTARLWALARGIVWAEGKVQPLSRVTLDGKMLLMNGDGSVDLVDVRSGDRTSLQSARHGLPPGSVWPWRGCLSVDGRVAALRDTEGLLVVWELIDRTHRTVGRYDDPGTRVSADELSPDGSLLAQIDDRGAIRVVETATGSARRIGQLEDQGFGIAWSGDGRLLAAGGRDGSARVWDVATGTVRASLRSGGMILDIALSRDGKRFVAAGTDGIVSVVDIGTGAVRRLVGHVGAVSSADFLPDGDRLLSLGSDGTVRLWDLGHDEKGLVVRREGKPLGWLRVSADGSLVTSVSTDETTVWSTSSLPPSPHEALGDLPAFRRSIGAWTTAEVDGDTGALRSP